MRRMVRSERLVDRVEVHSANRSLLVGPPTDFLQTGEIPSPRGLQVIEELPPEMDATSLQKAVFIKKTPA